jgi:photosystem II stability/assembly factor-like uncharacterized protein
MIMPTISPHDPSIVLEHCDMTGAYITVDGGVSWRMFNLRSVVRAFAFHPRDPRVIYAGNAALWRSDDTGKTWRMVWPDPTRNTVEHMRGDHADFLLTSDDPSYQTGVSIEAIAEDPADSHRIYLAVGRGGSGLLLSEDRGKTWSRLGEFGSDQVRAVHVPASGPRERAVYVITDHGVHHHAGGRWERRSGPPGRIQYAAVGVTAASAEPIIYAVAARRVYRSGDGGASWQDLTEAILQGSKPGGRRPPDFTAIACSERAPDTAYLGFRNVRLGDGKIHSGIAKTTDGGRSWQIVFDESDRAAENMEVSWIESRAPNGRPNIWFDAPYSLGVAPSDPDVCYATDLFRTYRTVDGGRTWQQVNSVRVGDEAWTTRGLDVTTCYGVHFDPFDVSHMFITYTDIGLFQSSDGGASWIGSTEGIPNTWRNTTYWIAFDPEVKGLIWGGFGLNHDLPRPKMWRGADPGDYKGGVAVSTDGGRHWRLSNEGMPETAVTHLLLDPSSPVGARVLYACGLGRGVFKSVDNGRTWALKNTGIEGEQPFAWRIIPDGGGALYLIVARRNEEGKPGDEGDGALYRSTDGAEHWTKLALPAGCNGPVGLAVDPTDWRRMYLAAWGVMGELDDSGGGLFLSTDGGETWRNVFSESQHVYDVTIDPRDPKTLYICGFDAAAYRSADGGKTWARIKGYNVKWGHRVILDPVNPGMIYITTFGGSVWHGPAQGDPKAREDIVTPVPLATARR